MKIKVDWVIDKDSGEEEYSLEELDYTFEEWEGLSYEEQVDILNMRLENDIYSSNPYVETFKLIENG